MANNGTRAFDLVIYCFIIAHFSGCIWFFMSFCEGYGFHSPIFFGMEWNKQEKGTLGGGVAISVLSKTITFVVGFQPTTWPWRKWNRIWMMIGIQDSSLGIRPLWRSGFCFHFSIWWFCKESNICAMSSNLKPFLSEEKVLKKEYYSFVRINISELCIGEQSIDSA